VGTAGQELLIDGLLITLSIAVVAVCVLVLIGLRGRPPGGTGIGV
jgi:hypothetical protein